MICRQKWGQFMKWNISTTKKRSCHIILNREITETLPKCVENLSQHHIGTKRGNQTQHTTSGIRSLEKKNMFHLKMSHVHLKSNQIHQIRTPAKKILQIRQHCQGFRKIID